jgi:hypothetical protein
MPPVAFAALCSALGAGMLAAPACVLPSISTGSADAGPATPAAAADAGAAATEGASCTQVSATIALCQYISSCPSLALSAKVFAQCGFHVHGDAIDPECLCGTSLCPIGHPTTCAEAAALSTGDVNYDSVCEQATVGGCTDLGAATGTGTSSACQTCVANCDNVPSCIDACGC